MERKGLARELDIVEGDSRSKTPLLLEVIKRSTAGESGSKNNHEVKLELKCVYRVCLCFKYL